MVTTSADLGFLDEIEPKLLEIGASLDAGRNGDHALWSIPAMRALALVDVPPDHNPHPFSELGLGLTARTYPSRLRIVERLARIDVNCLMALPGPSLSAHILIALGTRAQQDRFFGHFTEGPRRAFLAVTESHAGSDVSSIRSHLSRVGDAWRLTANKILIGGVPDASVGLVCARFEDTNRTCMVMVEPQRARAEFHVQHLETFGLRGASLATIVAHDLPVDFDLVMGYSSPLRGSIMAMSEVFLRHRPMVGAMALGTGLGLIDAARLVSGSAGLLSGLEVEHAALFRQMVRLGEEFEHGRLKMHGASLFKLSATRFAERVAGAVVSSLPLSELISSADVLRRYRDAFAFEYAEGTTNMQLLNAHRSWLATVSS